MEYYVGLDVSLKQTSICVVDQSGSVVREGVVDVDRARSLARSFFIACGSTGPSSTGRRKRLLPSK